MRTNLNCDSTSSTAMTFKVPSPMSRTVSSSTSSSSSSIALNPLYDSNFVDQLRDLYADGDLLDFDVKLNGKKVFRMHKIVAYICCPMLKGMISSNMKESLSNNYEIISDEVTDETLEAIVNYFYYGRLRLTLENVGDMLKSCNYLLLEDCKSICEQYIISHLNINNVLDMHMIAELYDCLILQRCSNDYIMNHFDSIVKTENWDVLDESEIQAILVQDNLMVEKEMIVFSALLKWFEYDKSARLASFKRLFANPKVLRMQFMSKDEKIQLHECEVIKTLIENPVPLSFKQYIELHDSIKTRLYFTVPSTVSKILHVHSSSLVCMVVYENKLITGSWDGRIKVWNALTFELEHTFVDHQSCVVGLVLWNDILVSCSYDKTIKLWDLHSFKLKANLDQLHHDSVLCVAIMDDVLFSGADDQNIVLYHLGEEKAVGELSGHLGGVTCLKLYNRKLLSGSHDGTIILWDLDTMVQSQVLSYHTDSVMCLLVTDNKLLSGSRDSTIKVYNLLTEQLETTIDAHSDSVMCLIMYNSKLISSSYDKTIKIYYKNSYKVETSLSDYTDSGIYSLLILNNKLISGSYDGTLKIWQ